jgi:hypothetical protein
MQVGLPPHVSARPQLLSSFATVFFLLAIPLNFMRQDFHGEVYAVYERPRRHPLALPPADQGEAFASFQTSPFFQPHIIPYIRIIWPAEWKKIS